MLLVLVLGRRHLPHSAAGWWTTLGDSAPRIGVIGVTIVASRGGCCPGVRLHRGRLTAGGDPVRTFQPLIGYFCLPILALGVLMALGVVPI